MNDVCETNKPLNVELKKNNKTLGTMILLPTTVGIISIDKNLVQLNVPDIKSNIDIFVNLEDLNNSTNENY